MIRRSRNRDERDVKFDKRKEWVVGIPVAAMEGKLKKDTFVRGQGRKDLGGKRRLF